MRGIIPHPSTTPCTRDDPEPYRIVREVTLQRRAEWQPRSANGIVRTIPLGYNTSRSERPECPDRDRRHGGARGAPTGGDPVDALQPPGASN
jgi:hypothetical protein